MPRYRAMATFEQLVAFSKAYMAEHSGNAVARSLDDELVFVVAGTHFSIRAGLIDDDGEWVDDTEGWHERRVNEPSYGIWLGYPDWMPYGFKWQSCSNSVLIARQSDNVGGESLYELECRPAHNQDQCGYMDLLSEQGVYFDEVARPEGGWAEQDEEPAWTEPALDRPASYC